MKNILTTLSQNKKLVFFILLGFIIISVSFKIKEGFDMSSLNTSLNTSLDTSLTTVSKDIPEQYKYLAPLPEGSVWTPEFQDIFVTKYKEKDPNFKKEILTTPLPQWGGKTFMEIASQNEAEYFLENGLWPYDEYVINYLSKERNPPLSASGIEDMRKNFPNRLAYMTYILNSSVPEIKMLGQISYGYNDIPNEIKWGCEDSGKLVINENYKQSGSGFKESTDYSFFPNKVPGFSFEGDQCNICDIRKMAKDKKMTVSQYYNSPENTCRFKMSGEVPEAYNIYIGKYGNAKSESTPSSTTSTSSGDEYQKCISGCDKYK